MGYVLLARLPCLVSVGKEAPSLSDTLSARVGAYPRVPHLVRGEEEEGWGRIVGRCDQEGAVSEM